MNLSIRNERTRYLLEQADRERWRRTERRLQEMLGYQQVEEQLLRNEMRLRSQTEVQLREANVHLNNLAVELQASNTALVRSNRDLEQFAYVASHDLQEPLRMVAQNAALLREQHERTLGDSALRSLHFLCEGAERMSRLVHDLLHYSRIGEHVVLTEEVDCNEVVQRALVDLQGVIEDTCATIDVGPLPTVAGNRRMLQQLFQNLVGNALKFGREVPPQVTISSTVLPEGVAIAVADNGIGIKPEHQERIFRIFQRLHPQEEYSGTGIGLAVAQRIVLRHGGQIELQSEPGVGSTFRVLLPASHAIIGPGEQPLGEPRGPWI